MNVRFQNAMPEYEPAPEGYLRTILAEYTHCQEVGLPEDTIIANCGTSLGAEIFMSHRQTHVIMDASIPPEKLTAMIQWFAAQTMLPQGDEHSVVFPYHAFTVEECAHLDERTAYEHFYEGIADQILSAPSFIDQERFRDIAKWIKGRFDKFVMFPLNPENRYIDDILGRGNLPSQVMLDATHNCFSRNLAQFMGHFNYRLHPIIHFGTDAPVYTEAETREVIDRFYTSVHGLDRESMRAALDGRENDAALKRMQTDFRAVCADTNPDELEGLARTANNLYWAEWSFMYQGAPREITLVLPRWVITLQEEFAGDWQSSFHPLLNRGTNKKEYRYEAQFVSYVRC